MHPKFSILVFLLSVSTISMCQRFPAVGSNQTLRARSYDVLNQFLNSGKTTSLHEKCGLPAISYAIKNRRRLRPEVESALEVILSRPDNQKSILVGSMRVHYDTTGDYAPSMLDSLYQKIPGTADQFADSVAAIANYCEMFEAKVLGYLPIPSDGSAGGGPEHDIYITDLGDYGYTSPDSVLLSKPNDGDGETWTSFTTIDNSFQFVNPSANKGMPGLRVTLAHELHHSIQLGSYGYWSNDIFFHEITSVWMEDVVFPQVKDYIQYTSSSAGHFANPWVPFNSNDFIMYSRGIWGHFIAKRFGRDAMRRSWEEARFVPPLQAVDNALSKAPYNSSFIDAFAEWTGWNYFTGARSDSVRYYPEGALYPEIASSSLTFSPPTQTGAGTLYALSSAYLIISFDGNTFPYIVSNINLDSAIIRYPLSFPYTYSIAEAGNDSLTANFYVPDKSGWFNKILGNDWSNTILIPGTSIAAPFPDPFYPNGSSDINFPVGGTNPVAGELSIFSADMKLVYSGSLSSTMSIRLGSEVIKWNGIKNNAEMASSGVYIYFIQMQGQSIKGKFALLRK